MQFEEFEDCLKWYKNRVENERSWKVASSDILSNGCNLDRRNPAVTGNIEHMPPEKIIESIITKEKKMLSILSELRSLLEHSQVLI